MNSKNAPADVSLRDVILKVRSAVSFLRKKWVLILICSLLGGAVSLSYALRKRQSYKAICTFVLEDSKGNSLGQYAGLASIAGIDLGAGGASGLFQGDNILELYKSRIMIEKTLLSEVNIDGKNQLLIDRYIEFNKLNEKWQNKDHIGQINFQGNPENFGRKRDSIMAGIVELFNQKILDISKPDKKLTIIEVDVTTPDEMFSKAFNEKLVENVNNFYTQTKTKKSIANVMVLQKQADSVKKVLDESISGVASSLDAAPNANPSLLSLKVPSQKKQISVQANSAIYSEIVKNLELSKISLRQEAPLIQIIDKPILPLTVIKPNKLLFSVLGFFLSLILVVLFLLINKVYKDTIK
jgi:uncharacterized protein involved in exopolysaccharide biosynthesis